MRIDLPIILEPIEFEYSSIILFGSVARNEYTVNSDIDILVITKMKINSFSKGNINYTIYTEDQLKKMALVGSLFILHLIRESTTIWGKDIIFELKNIFARKESYSSYRKELDYCFDLLDINEKHFYELDKKPFTLLKYLLRSYLYSESKDLNFINFSIERVLIFLGCTNLGYIFEHRTNDYVSYELFVRAKEDCEEYLKRKINNEFKSIEALIINSYPLRKLLIILGIRLIKRETYRLNYEGIIIEHE